RGDPKGELVHRKPPSKQRPQGIEIDRLIRAGFWYPGVGSRPAAQWPDPEGVFLGADRAERTRHPHPLDRARFPIDQRSEARRANQWPAPVIRIWSAD